MSNSDIMAHARSQLRFIGWFLLGILSLGIGFLWLIPYVMTSNAWFYGTLIHPEINQSGPVPDATNA